MILHLFFTTNARAYTQWRGDLSASLSCFLLFSFLLLPSNTINHQSGGRSFWLQFAEPLREEYITHCTEHDIITAYYLFLVVISSRYQLWSMHELYLTLEIFNLTYIMQPTANWYMTSVECTQCYSRGHWKIYSSYKWIQMTKHLTVGTPGNQCLGVYELWILNICI